MTFRSMFRRPGGDKIYKVFDNQLPAAIKKLPLDRHLSLQNVKRVVSEADGYQPHLIAPEQGYRRLIDGSLGYFKGPAEATVDAVSKFLSGFNYSESNGKNFNSSLELLLTGALCASTASKNVNLRDTGKVLQCFLYKV